MASSLLAPVVFLWYALRVLYTFYHLKCYCDGLVFVLVKKGLEKWSVLCCEVIQVGR
jgi:hypothetical protein